MDNLKKYIEIINKKYTLSIFFDDRDNTVNIDNLNSFKRLSFVEKLELLSYDQNIGKEFYFYGKNYEYSAYYPKLFLRFENKKELGLKNILKLLDFKRESKESMINNIKCFLYFFEDKDFIFSFNIKYDKNFNPENIILEYNEIMKIMEQYKNKNFQKQDGKDNPLKIFYSDKKNTKYNFFSYIYNSDSDCVQYDSIRITRIKNINKTSYDNTSPFS